MEVKIINNSRHPLPSYQTESSSGMDLRADLNEAIVLKPMQRALIPTNLFIEIPRGYEAQIRPRSGLAYKNGVTVLNSPGTIDADYRGEIKILLINLSDENFTVENGERIAQMVVTSHAQIKWIPVKELASSQRAAGGFGSTGTK